jgi:NAD(P)-dependent dehydrogenase (short-subunit alcohol dehydrogenase family)
MTVIDPESLFFEYKLRYRGTPGLEHDPVDYPLRWEVAVSFPFPTPGGDEERQLGSAVVQVVPKAGMINLFLTTGTADQEMAKAVEMLTTDRPDLIREYLQDGGDLMIVSSLEIFPEYRGGRTGYSVLNAIVETVGRSVNLVVVHAAPADGAGSPPADSAEYEEAKAALRAYWKDFGFEDATGDYLVFFHKKILA